MEIFPPQRERRGEKRAKKSLPQRSNYLEMIKQSSQKFIQRLLRDSGAFLKNRFFDFPSYSLLSPLASAWIDLNCSSAGASLELTFAIYA